MRAVRDGRHSRCLSLFGRGDLGLYARDLENWVDIRFWFYRIPYCCLHVMCVCVVFDHSLTCSRGYILGVCSSYVLLDPDADLHEVATKSQKVRPH